MRGRVPSTISRMKAPAAIAARLPAWNRVGALDPTGDRRFGIETGFLSTCRVRVGRSTSISKNDIIFFSLRAVWDYYMENNTSQRPLGVGVMRFLPVFFDTSAGVFILVGSGEAALAKLRLLRAAGAHVRWFSRDADVAEVMLTASGKGRLEISLGDPLTADLSDVVAIVSAAGTEFDAEVAARARAQRIPVNVVDRPELSTFIFPADRRSRRGRGRDRHRRKLAGAGAAPARADRGHAAGAHRRPCRADRPPSQPFRGGAARAVAAPVLAERHRRPDRARRRLPDAPARRKRQLVAAHRRDQGASMAAARAKPCFSSAPAPAIPTC